MEWISVDDRLPSPIIGELLRADGSTITTISYPEVLVAYADGRVSTAYLWNPQEWRGDDPEWSDNRGDSDITDITHWMPMPPPPNS